MTEPDFFGSAEATPAVTFPTEGEWHTGVVTRIDTDVQGTDFTTKLPATWKGGDPKLSIVIGLNIDGEDQALWVTKYRKDPRFVAIAQAQTVAGATIKPGGKLAIRWQGTKPTNASPQHLYEAKYAPGEPVNVFADDSPPF